MGLLRNHPQLIFAIGLLILLTGCAQITVHSTVTAEETIDEYRVQINTSRTVYGLLEQSAEDEGYDSLRESFLSDVNESRAGEVEYDERFDGDSASIILTIHDFKPTNESSISISREDGMLVYEDTTFVNETETAASDESDISASFLSGLAVDYYLTMPGEIVDSNANTVEGNTAEWHETGADAFTNTRVYAKSEVPTGVFAPGFGIVPALSAFLLIVVLLHHRRSAP